jgi:hypothetical protein
MDDTENIDLSNQDESLPCSSGLKRYYTIEDDAGARRCVPAVNLVGLPGYAAYRRQPEVKPLHVLDEA